uniref:DUF4774 domain-containing protein n=1 Tax=Anopheles farauti TaxID=69004 RepID=A0A182R075_9DIPT
MIAINAVVVVVAFEEGTSALPCKRTKPTKKTKEISKKNISRPLPFCHSLAMFKLVVIILCFATLLVSTGSALKKDEYEISIKHGAYAVHQRHSENAVNTSEGARAGTSRSVPLAPTIAPGSASKENVQQRNEQFFGAGVKSGPDRGEGEGERISTTLAVPKPTVQSVSNDRVTPSVRPIPSVDFNAVSPGLEEVPLQANIFQSSLGRGQGRVVSYQTVEYYAPNDETTTEREAAVVPETISSEDFYNTPQLRERGPVLFSTEPTTTTTTTIMSPTTVKPPGKLFKAIPKSAVEENEEIYLLLKYEHPRKNSDDGNAESVDDASKASENRERKGKVESARTRSSQQQANRSKTRGRPQTEEQSDNFLQEGLRAGGSFTTVGYFVSDTETTTSMTPVSTSTKNLNVENTPATEAPSWRTKSRGSPNKLRNSYGDYLSADFKDFEDSIRPIEENVDETPEGEEDGEEAGEDAGNNTPVDIDDNLDINEMTRILAGRQGGLTISEFNRLFKDYLKKEITADDAEDFAKLESESKETAPDTTEPSKEDATKSFDIRAENGKKVPKVTGALPGPSAAQKQQLDQLKVLVNKGALKGGRKEKVVKIGYGGSKSYQGVFKSPKFLEKVRSERPVPSDGSWSGLEYRLPLPMREIGPMAYVDNPVFGFVPGGRARGKVEVQKGANGGQSYVKFQKIS